MDFRIGVDIGGTNIAAALVDVHNNLTAKVSVKTEAPCTGEQLTEKTVSVIEQLVAGIDPKNDRILGVGVVSPGLIKSGVILTANNLGIQQFDLLSHLSQKVPFPIAVCNDANAAALGEAVAGEGKGCHSLVMITIGTGIGGGIVINKKIVDGFNGAGAEIGHMVIDPNGLPCSCGNRGCFETYCSASAVARDTKLAMQQHPESKLWQVCPNIEDVDGKTLFDAMKLGDATAKAVFDEFIKHFGMALANIITLLQPEIICIGGGMSNEGKTVTDPLTEYIHKIPLLQSLKTTTKIVPAALKNSAGIIGAVHLTKELTK